MDSLYSLKRMQVEKKQSWLVNFPTGFVELHQQTTSWLPSSWDSSKLEFSYTDTLATCSHDLKYMYETVSNIYEAASNIYETASNIYEAAFNIYEVASNI